MCWQELERRQLLQLKARKASLESELCCLQHDVASGCRAPEPDEELMPACGLALCA
jgi:hypothetical protein